MNSDPSMDEEPDQSAYQRAIAAVEQVRAQKRVEPTQALPTVAPVVPPSAAGTSPALPSRDAIRQSVASMMPYDEPELPAGAERAAPGPAIAPAAAVGVRPEQPDPVPSDPALLAGFGRAAGAGVAPVPALTPEPATPVRASDADRRASGSADDKPSAQSGGKPNAQSVAPTPAVDAPRIVLSSATSADPRLCELDFSDLFIETSGRVWYKRTLWDECAVDVSGQALRDAAQLLAQCLATQAVADFSLSFQDIPLRVDRVSTRAGDVFVCRRLNSTPKPIAELGFSPKLIGALVSGAFHHGLVLISGSPGAGKTTTLAATAAARLTRYGGTAYTIENPLELGLEGVYRGENGVVGTCYQTQVASDADFGAAIVRRLRSGATQLYIGEIRTPEAAAEAALAGASGQLVGATMHASSPMAALERFHAWLGAAGQDISLFGESLAVLLHQQLVIDRKRDGIVRRVIPSPLIVSGQENEAAIRANLRTGSLGMLVNEISQQKRHIAGVA
uniref:ATPase, T2SS/T4P/T4SS family n=1 Tax=Burkholderia arboris TaxID=488730 RepID=UPI003BEF194B